jgi:hypothetical protein
MDFWHGVTCRHRFVVAKQEIFEYGLNSYKTGQIVYKHSQFCCLDSLILVLQVIDRQ